MAPLTVTAAAGSQYGPHWPLVTETQGAVPTATPGPLAHQIQQHGGIACAAHVCVTAATAAGQACAVTGYEALASNITWGRVVPVAAAAGVPNPAALRPVTW